MHCPKKDEKGDTYKQQLIHNTMHTIAKTQTSIKSQHKGTRNSATTKEEASSRTSRSIEHCGSRQVVIEKCRLSVDCR